MGKLRLVSKTKTMDPAKYRSLLEVLREARQAATENKIYWDLEKEEQASQTRKDFLYVAEKEGFNINIRQLRKSRSLIFEFPASTVERTRMSGDVYKKKVLETLKASDGPMKKSDVIKQAGLSATTWHFRIRELLEAGEVLREGTRGEAIYSLPK